MIRFFAEATQSSTRLWPGPNLPWEPVDAQPVRARVRDGELAASMVCRFRRRGRAHTLRERRPAAVRCTGKLAQRWVPARWVTTRGAFRRMGALRVPMTMDVSWILPGAAFEQVRTTTQAPEFDEPAAYPGAPTASMGAAR